jgi:hypothetical protein
MSGSREQLMMADDPLNGAMTCSFMLWCPILTYARSVWWSALRWSTRCGMFRLLARLCALHGKNTLEQFDTILAVVVLGRQLNHSSNGDCNLELMAGTYGASSMNP